MNCGGGIRIILRMQILEYQFQYFKNDKVPFELLHTFSLLYSGLQNIHLSILFERVTTPEGSRAFFPFRRFMSSTNACSR